MKKGLLSLLALLGFAVAFAQEKPKTISTELIQLRVDPRYKSEKQQQVKLEGNTKQVRSVELRQNPNANAANPTPIKVNLRPMPKKQENPIQEIKNK